MEQYRHRRTPDSLTGALWQFYQHCHLVAKHEELVKEIINLALRIIFVHTAKGFLKCRKILRHVANDFPSLMKKGLLRIFIALKNRSRPGLNLRSLGPMASMLAITLPTKISDMLQRIVWQILTDVSEDVTSM
jgi:hypothetical protein